MSRYLKDFEGSFAVVENGFIRSRHGFLLYAEKEAKRVRAARQLDPAGCRLEVWRLDPSKRIERGMAPIGEYGVEMLWSSE